MKKRKSWLFGLLLFGCSTQGYKNISMDEAQKMMAQDDIVIIDVREEDEYNEGHIPDAILIPLSLLDQNDIELPNQDQTLLIYCRSGRRSKQAAQKFVKLGYTDVYNIGGILDWTGQLEK